MVEFVSNQSARSSVKRTLTIPVETACEPLDHVPVSVVALLMVLKFDWARAAGSRRSVAARAATAFIVDDIKVGCRLRCLRLWPDCDDDDAIAGDMVPGETVKGSKSSTQLYLSTRCSVAVPLLEIATFRVASRSTERPSISVWLDVSGDAVARTRL